MKSKIFEKENLIFGAIWGALVIFIGAFLVGAIDLIQKITGTLLEWALKIFVFPATIADVFKMGTIVRVVIILAITILTAPVIRKAFIWLVKLFKKSPV